MRLWSQKGEPRGVSDVKGRAFSRRKAGRQDLSVFLSLWMLLRDGDKGWRSSGLLVAELGAGRPGRAPGDQRKDSFRGK